MTSDMPRTEAAFSKVIAWAEAHPDASWEESAQNVLTTLSQELADMERELANCKRDLAIMVGRADNEERATERAETAEAKLAALQAPQDVAGLVNSIRALRSARHEWENAPSSELLTLDAAIDALLSLSAQLAEKEAENVKLRGAVPCCQDFDNCTQRCFPRAEHFKAECEGLRQDAERFQYLQNIPVVVAQQFFWNYSSRKERAKAIDSARKP